uniref:Fucolectin tachylectin-4 pentraxin-1 domain-containing protein n=1 Tax=Podarcis muralis TaxID=64176 RepID=A0A670J4Y9_PODMU
MLQGRTVRCCLLLMLLTILPTRPALEDTNVALAGEASQSSTYSSLGAAGNAIDGSTASNFNQGSCTHTNSENNPWWMVDLKAQYQVLRVTITNRKDCCAQRLNGAEIRVGDSAERGGTTNPRYCIWILCFVAREGEGEAPQVLLEYHSPHLEFKQVGGGGQQYLEGHGFPILSLHIEMS